MRSFFGPGNLVREGREQETLLALARRSSGVKHIQGDADAQQGIRIYHQVFNMLRLLSLATLRACGTQACVVMDARRH
jgi:hypothetical protein